MARWRLIRSQHLASKLGEIKRLEMPASRATGVHARDVKQFVQDAREMQRLAPNDAGKLQLFVRRELVRDQNFGKAHHAGQGGAQLMRGTG